MIEPSSHSYEAWKATLARGMTPHGNPCSVVRVCPGMVIRLTTADRCYYTDGVRVALSGVRFHRRDSLALIKREGLSSWTAYLCE